MVIFYISWYILVAVIIIILNTWEMLESVKFCVRTCKHRAKNSYIHKNIFRKNLAKINANLGSTTSQLSFSKG